MKTQLLKSISRLLFLAFATSISVAQNIEYENLIDTKWKLTNYIIDGQSFPIDKKRKKDYFIFKEKNQKEEVLFGEKVRGTWEFLPHGNFIMFYSEKMDVYVPARITELNSDTLRIAIFDIKIMKMITFIYKSNQ
ncbi:MAG: hypothetical protein CMG71_07410 [Candidatus Marinimicrobia bacterium]|nr:hypothetical protein [Candidatus Neomarinimicrobiota bacterium]|tara:strand:- start:1177 stop:1581 length:405 start_codon:yes stop_codon:yes gene_type:complete